MINLMRVGDLRNAEKYPVHQIFCNDMVDAEDVIINVFMNLPLSLFTSSRKRNTRGFIGGGQRVRAIRMFMADELKINGPSKFAKYLPVDLPVGRKYSELSDEDRKRFDQTKIILYSYIGLTKRQEALVNFNYNKYRR